MKNILFEQIVNKEFPLDKNYLPNDLIITDENENNFHNYLNSNQKPQISASILPFFNKMQEDALKDGLHIIVDSGYRSYEYQAALLKRDINELGNEQAIIGTALPGASEHQTGYAFDLASIRNGKYFENSKDDEPEIIWMLKNSYKYGFILRYPQGKEKITGFKYEPWHYRFVGLELAEILYDKGITMEEYEKLKNKVDSNNKSR